MNSIVLFKRNLQTFFGVLLDPFLLLDKIWVYLNGSVVWGRRSAWSYRAAARAPITPVPPTLRIVKRPAHQPSIGHDPSLVHGGRHRAVHLLPAPQAAGLFTAGQEAAIIVTKAAARPQSTIAKNGSCQPHVTATLVDRGTSVELRRGGGVIW